MGHYDALADTNYCYLHLLSEYQFDPKIYFSWRHFLEITNLEGWKSHMKNFESYDDYISFCILDWAFHIQDSEIENQSIELSTDLLSVDKKLFSYCKSQIEHDGVISILKDHLIVKKLDFLKVIMAQITAP
jgi:hypothetical protein